CVVDRHGRYTYDQLAADVLRCAHGLRALGLGRDDVAIIELPNWYQWDVVHLALTAIGAITVYVPPIYRQRELTYIAQTADAKLLVMPDTFRRFDYRPMARDVRAAAPCLAHVLVVGEAGDDLLAYDAFMARPWEDAGGLAALRALRPHPDDVTALGFTSGTTGAMKAAMQTSNVLNATNLSFINRYGLTADERIFVPSPVGHAIGFTHGVRIALYLGAAAVLQEIWEPGQALDLIAAERCTFVAAAPPFLRDLVYHPDVERVGGLPSLRVFLCGGAPVPEQLLLDARERLPRTFVGPLWGMTECGGATTCPFDAPFEKLVHTDGCPVQGMEVLVVDAEGRVLPPDTPGELLVRGPQSFVGYYQRPDLNATLIRPDAFFHTGDQARLDRDGYVTITGRLKDLIIRGGVNIAPVEIEDLLFAHPAVAAAAVVGMPDERLGERICAFVVPGPGATVTLPDVQTWMERHGLAKQKWPERVEVVESFPMTPSGKVQKHVLRQRIAETLAREGGGAC
ncbi:MAG: AMP-binding protein, partial [Chloroflexi bacterium]|nr:AMP-binding protein [Chloroflexota bacterium]